MTTERIKSIGILSATLVVGILLGVLLSGFYQKVSDRHGKKVSRGRGHEMEKKSDWFASTITRIVEPDDKQKAKMKPVFSWAAARLDSIEQYSNFQATRVLDSVKIQLRPILTEKQLKKLEKFDEQAKSNWYRHDKVRHR